MRSVEWVGETAPLGWRASAWGQRVRLGLAVVGAIACVVSPATALTAIEHLQGAPKPRFRSRHTLLPLSRWGWSMPFKVKVELCENWGYALEFGAYATESYVAQLGDPESEPSRLVALTAGDPERYPLFVLTHRPLGDTKVVASLPAETWVHDAEGNPFDDRSFKLWSPEAPMEVFVAAAEGTAVPLRKIREKAPIAVVLNGGEYGLNVFGHSGEYWKQDPSVLRAKGKREWFDYVSARKAQQEVLISKAVRDALPDCRLYLWYHFGGCPTWDAWSWSFDYKQMRMVSDLPDQSLYYKHFNSGWNGSRDLLTLPPRATEGNEYGQQAERVRSQRETLRRSLLDMIPFQHNFRQIDIVGLT